MINVTSNLDARNKTNYLMSDLKTQVAKLTKNASLQEKANVIGWALEEVGLRTENLNQDFFGCYAANGTNKHYGESIPLFNSKVKLSNPNVKAALNAKFASEGDGFLTQTSLITGVLDMVTPTGGCEEILAIFPENNYSALNLYIDIFDPIIGVTNQKNDMGDMPLEVAKRAINTNLFKGGVYQEYAAFDQATVIGVREFGNQNVSVMGLGLLLAKTQEQLETRRINRVALTETYGVINNSTSYLGNNLSLGIPASNIIDWADYSGYLGTIDIATNEITPSDASVYPMLNVIDMADMVTFRYKGKYKLVWLMNNRTQDLWNQHPNITSYSQYLNANTSVVNSGTGTVNTFEGSMKYLITGMEQEVVISHSAYYPDQHDPFGNAQFANVNNQGQYITGTYGTAVPIMPDGYIIAALIPTNKTGPCFEFAYQPSWQKGGVMNPQPGPVMTMVDTMASNTLQGAAVPNLYLLQTFNGGLRPLRAFDVFVFKVATVIS